MRDEPLLKISYRDPEEGWEGMLVIDSLVRGGCIGGCRVSRTVTMDEVARLARGMSRKQRTLGLTCGGGKSGVRINPNRPDKEAALLRFFTYVRPLVRDFYGIGPDMNTSDALLNGIATQLGLEWRLGAIAPAEERTAAKHRYQTALALPYGPFTFGYARTGMGSAACALRAIEFLGLGDKLRIALHGFGTVGAPAAWSMEQNGHTVVAVADAGGGYYNPDGLPFENLYEARNAGGGIIKDSLLPKGTQKMEGDEIVTVPADVIIMAATPDVINADRAGQVQAKLVVEPANIAITPQAVIRLHSRGIPVIPDSVASGGGVATAIQLARGFWVHDDVDKLVSQMNQHLGDATVRLLESAKELNVPLPQALDITGPLASTT